MKNIFVILLMVFICSCSVVTKHVENSETPLVNEKTNFAKANAIYDILGENFLKEHSIIIFSSRDYTVNIAEILKNTDKEIYWVIPEDEFRPEDIVSYLKLLENTGIKHDLKPANEGLVGTINDVSVSILPKKGIETIVSENPVLIVDVDFFFRINRNKITQPKSMDVITFYRTLDEYNIKPSTIVLVKSLDISLPDWVQEFSYLVEKIFVSWQKKELPVAIIALDEADRLINFAQYEEAYQLLKEIQSQNQDNPFFYERLFWASMKTFRDNDLIEAAEKAYVLDGTMIRLYLEGVDYLLEKNELYPAYVLIKKGYNKEPWNKNLREKFEEVVQAGYNYYNMHGEAELFEIFKKEKENLSK